MKKVGILTFHWADNFGASLQSFALQKEISRLGCEPEIINFKPKSLTMPYEYRLDLNDIRILLRGYPVNTIAKTIIDKIIFYGSNLKRRRAYDNFRDKYLKISGEALFSVSDMDKRLPRYDYYVVGSDQVWNPIFLRKADFVYGLGFVGDKGKKVSYAASVAQDIPSAMMDDYKRFLGDFKAISVREKDAKESLERLTGRNIENTIDPVFFLEKSEWKKLSKGPKKTPKHKFIMVYDIHIDKNAIEIINEFSRVTGYEVVNYSRKLSIIKSPYAKSAGCLFYNGTEEFLWYVDNADLIITSSFHGTALSLIYNKPFFAFLDPLKGCRINDLLGKIGMGSRIIFPTQGTKGSIVSKLTDELGHTSFSGYIEAGKILEENIRYSKDFLRRALDIEISQDKAVPKESNQGVPI